MMSGGDVDGPLSLRADLARLRDGRVVSTYLSEICDRIDRVDAEAHSFLPEPGRRDRLLAAGDVSCGPWRGVPVGIKDVIHVDGLETRSGSTLPPATLAGPQASIVSCLRKAGAVIVGKTVTAEFAVAAPGPTTNPRCRECSPGGSSSGSAAAVAAGLVPLTFGTETISSVIRPAAYCGVVGFKLTPGRLPLDGVILNAPSLDTLGWFVAEVADAVTAAEAVCPEWRPIAVPDRMPVVGIPAAEYLAMASDHGRRAFERHVEILRAAGCQVRYSTLFENVDDLSHRLFVINRWELARTHSAWFAAHGERYRPQTAAAIRQGQQIDHAVYASAIRWRRDFIDAFIETTTSAGVDLWLAPAATGTAPASLATTGDSAMGYPFSLAGSAGLSIPAGRDGRGLPWGLQCAAVGGEDEQLLAFGILIERALPAPNVRL